MPPRRYAEPVGRASEQSSIRKIIAAWRRLTSPPRARRRGPGEPVLVACSGGADSSALVLALASAGARGVVAHIVHDLRHRRAAVADRDSARRLAERVGWPFVAASVKVKALKGSAEANARHARYHALARLAARRGLRFIATAHQADDQIETVLMRLLRGAAPTALAGIRERRSLSDSVLIRPMLGISRAQARAICKSAGWTWREDATNADRTRLRARLRAEVVPRLRRIRPDLGDRVGTLAAQSAQLDRLLASRARRVLALATRAPLSGTSGTTTWPRARLAALAAREGGAAIGAALRQAITGTAPRGSHGAVASPRPPATRTGVPARTIDDILHAIADNDGSPRSWNLGAVHVTLDRDHLCVQR